MADDIADPESVESADAVEEPDTDASFRPRTSQLRVAADIPVAKQVKAKSVGTVDGSDVAPGGRQGMTRTRISGTSTPRSAHPRGGAPLSATTGPPGRCTELYQHWMSQPRMPSLYLHGADDVCATRDYADWVERILPEGSEVGIVLDFIGRARMSD